MAANSVLGTAALRRLKKKKQKEKVQQDQNQSFSKSQSVPGIWKQYINVFFKAF